MISEMQQIYSGLSVFWRAIGCAHFSGAETSLINHVIDVAWLRPRLIYGKRKSIPAEVRPTRQASLTGYDQATISRALANLRDGNVLIQQDDGKWLPNPKWWEWLENRTGELAINPACYHYVKFGADESQVLHDCEVTPDDAAPHATTVDGHAETHTTTVNGHAETHGTAVANMERAARINSSQSEPFESADSDRSKKHLGYIYIADKPIDQQREPTSADDRMQSTIVGHSGAQSENVDIYIYPDNASQSPIGPEDGQASADPSPIITANPAPTNPADTAAGSPTRPATALPTSRTANPPTEAHGGHSGAYSSPHGHPRTEPVPSAATIANNHASSHEAMPNRTAVEYTMAGELPGPFTVDADQWRAFVALTDQYMPMREIASKLYLYRRQFPTAWFVRIAKRCVLTKDKKSITHGYMLSILRAWGRNEDGPDIGPEEEYRDDLSMIAVPFVPFTSTIMGNSEGVELDAYGEPSRFAPGVKAKIIEMMNERMRRNAL